MQIDHLDGLKHFRPRLADTDIFVDMDTDNREALALNGKLGFWKKLDRWSFRNMSQPNRQANNAKFSF
ncbi:hypothetical protein JMJ56_25340 [Belnapia sp. T18]|uniref:Uncharacterized protein n=1 Tax=Belnapia arida TaxID=2804533 RepID=A0ABS1UBK8_9PROT|nr:hypothetical protein [Belnapia arida]MBL6081324.1 hypothetical protein [Belnapia arida]